MFLLYYFKWLFHMTSPFIKESKGASKQTTSWVSGFEDMSGEFKQAEKNFVKNRYLPLTISVQNS